MVKGIHLLFQIHLDSIETWYIDVNSLPTKTMGITSLSCDVTIKVTFWNSKKKDTRPVGNKGNRL